MSIVVNTGVTNLGGTPGLLTFDQNTFLFNPNNYPAGMWFYETSTNALFYWNGTTYVQINSGGGGGTSTGINGLNGTTNIGLGGTLLNDTTISGNNFVFDFIGFKSLYFEENTINSFFNIDATQIKISSLGQGFWTINGVCAIGDVITGTGIQLLIDSGTNTLKTVASSGNNNGLYFDYNTNAYLFGSITGLSGQPQYFLFDNNLGQMSFYGGGAQYSLFFDWQTDYAFFGSPNAAGAPTYLSLGTNNGSFILHSGNGVTEIVCEGQNYNLYLSNYIYAGIWVDIPNAQFWFTLKHPNGANPPFEFGIYCNYESGVYWYGDNFTTGATLYFDTNIGRATLSSSKVEILTGSASGYRAQLNTSIFGDVDGNTNASIFGVDDNNQSLIASTNLYTTGSFSTSPYHLKINIGGVDYFIQLLQ